MAGDEGRGRDTARNGARPITARFLAWALAAFVTALGLPARAGAVTQTFTGVGPHTFLVPAGVTSVAFRLDGAAGGGTGSGVNLRPGGRGAEVITTLAVTPGEALQVNVGGAGASGGAGGFNGGGAGGNGVRGGNPGAGGGGASDGRDGSFALADRLLVAAGGGGAGGAGLTIPGGTAGPSGASGGNGDGIHFGAGGNGGGGASSSTPGGGGSPNGGAGGAPTQDQGGTGGD